MKCFNHYEKDSVGTCKQCGRGLCPSCIAPDLRSMACLHRCEEQVARLDGFLEQSVLNKYNTTLVGSLIAGFMFIFLGFFIANDFPYTSPYVWFLWVLGALLLLNGLRHRVSKKFKP